MLAAHIIAMAVSALGGALLFVLSLLVFDLTQAVLLAVYLLIVPIIAVVFWPSPDRATRRGR